MILLLWWYTSYGVQFVMVTILYRGRDRQTDRLD